MLTKQLLNTKKIQLFINPHHKNRHLIADKGMLEQTFINIIKNATESIQHGNGKIEIRVISGQNRKTIFQISNNGAQIPAEEIKNIYLPFFTTKDGGTGIGLSLSLQMIRMHGGNISCQSNEKQTTFEIGI